MDIDNEYGKHINILKLLHYNTLNSYFRYYNYNEVEQIMNIKRYFVFLSNIKEPIYKNVYLLGEEYEKDINQIINSLNRYSKEEVLKILSKAFGLIYDAINDLEYIFYKKDFDDFKKYEEIFYDSINGFNTNSKNGNKKILILDDDYEVLKILDIIFQKHNIDTILTTNSAKVFDILKNNYVDLIVLDYDMPRKSGLEVAQSIKENYNSIPFIFYSSNSDEGIIKKALDLGANKYLIKPQNERTIIKTIKDVFNEKSIDVEKVEPDFKFELDNFENNQEITTKKNNKVLILDTEEIIIKFIKSKLENENIEVMTSFSSKEISKMIFIEGIDLVIIDINIEENNDFNIIKGIKSNPNIKNTKIIIMTSTYSEKIKNESYSLGIDDFILKPFSIKELLIKVKKLLFSKP